MAEKPFKVALRPTRFAVICPACSEETEVDEWEGGGADGIWSASRGNHEIECQACEAPIDVVAITVKPHGEVSQQAHVVTSQTVLAAGKPWTGG